MPDSDSNESLQPECSDYESGHPGKSSVDSNYQRQQLGVNVFTQSADIVQSQPSPIKFGSHKVSPLQGQSDGSRIARRGRIL